MVVIDETQKHLDLDSIDKKIVDLLKNDSRISIQQIAKKAGVSRDVARYRLKKLVDLNVVSKFTLRFSPSLFYLDSFSVFIQMKEMGVEKRNNFEDFLKKQKEVVECISYFDKWDYKLRVVCGDVSFFDRLINSLSMEFNDVIIDMDILNETKDYLVSDKKTSFDEKDKNIMKVLLKDSRMSAVDIAKTENLTSDIVVYRLKKYMKIPSLQFITLFNQNKLGKHTYDLVFSFKYFNKITESNIHLYIKENPDILEAKKLLGNWNFFMRISVEEPMQLHSKVRKFKSTFGDMIKDFDIFNTYKEIKNEYFI